MRMMQMPVPVQHVPIPLDPWALTNEVAITLDTCYVNVQLEAIIVRITRLSGRRATSDLVTGKASPLSPLLVGCHGTVVLEMDNEHRAVRLWSAVMCPIDEGPLTLSVCRLCPGIAPVGTWPREFTLVATEYRRLARRRLTDPELSSRHYGVSGPSRDR